MECDRCHSKDRGAGSCSIDIRKRTLAATKSEELIVVNGLCDGLLLCPSCTKAFEEFLDSEKAR